MCGSLAPVRRQTVNRCPRFFDGTNTTTFNVILIESKPNNFSHVFREKYEPDLWTAKHTDEVEAIGKCSFTSDFSEIITENKKEECKILLNVHSHGLFL